MPFKLSFQSIFEYLNNSQMNIYIVKERRGNDRKFYLMKRRPQRNTNDPYSHQKTYNQK